MYFDLGAARVSDIMCDFVENSDPIAIAIGVFRRWGRPSVLRHVRFWGEFGPYSYRDLGYLGVWVARVSDVMCDFGENSDPIDIAIGVFRSRGRPSS